LMVGMFSSSHFLGLNLQFTMPYVALQFSHSRVNSHWITQRIDLFHITTWSSENWRSWLHSKFANMQSHFIAIAGAALRMKGWKSPKIGCHNGPGQAHSSM
jgi:hypothetical protein